LNYSLTLDSVQLQDFPNANETWGSSVVEKFFTAE